MTYKTLQSHMRAVDLYNTSLAVAIHLRNDDMIETILGRIETRLEIIARVVKEAQYRFDAEFIRTAISVPKN